MSNVLPSPNMSLPVPISGTTPGPEWASDLVSCLGILDAHTHSPGSGVQITPSGLNINADLPFGQTNNLTQVRSVRLQPQISAIAGASDIGCLYEAGVDLYYNDGNGNQIRITQSGSVSGSSGTITGLPSGTASAAYQSGSGSFQFQQATSTAANLDVGSVAIRYPGSYPTPSGNYIQLQAPSSLATGYALTLPATLPAASGSFLTESTAGILSYTTVDNSTLQLSASQISIKASGVGTSQIAALAVTKPKLAALGQQVSSSSGVTGVTTSASFSNVPNLSVTITTTGRPVFLVITSDGSGNPTVIGTGNATAIHDGYVKLKRGSTEIAQWQIRAGTALAANNTFNFIGGTLIQVDVPAAGTYTYQVQFASDSTGAQMNCQYAQLVAYEL